jgi:hypothetical protein
MNPKNFGEVELSSDKNTPATQKVAFPRYTKNKKITQQGVATPC